MSRQQMARSNDAARAEMTRFATVDPVSPGGGPEAILLAPCGCLVIDESPVEGADVLTVYSAGHCTGAGALHASGGAA
jgi:hypothetical protein